MKKNNDKDVDGDVFKGNTICSFLFL